MADEDVVIEDVTAKKPGEEDDDSDGPLGPEGDAKLDTEEAERREREEEAARDADLPEPLRAAKKMRQEMTPEQIIEKATEMKNEGNAAFKELDGNKAFMSYMQAVVLLKGMERDPENQFIHPKPTHTPAQRTQALVLFDTLYCNAALVQLKAAEAVSGADEKKRLLEEVVEGTEQAIKMNEKSLKARYRHGVAKARLAAFEEDDDTMEAKLLEAKTDLDFVTQEDNKNRDAIRELRAVMEQLKGLTKKRNAAAKKNFSFANALSGSTEDKPVDVLKDKTIIKTLKQRGDGGLWVVDEWLGKGSKKRCVVEVVISVRDGSKVLAKEVQVPFVLGDPDVPHGVQEAVKAMKEKEAAVFQMAPERVASTTPWANQALRKACREVTGVTEWEIVFLGFQVWDMVQEEGVRLLRVYEEGYGRFAEDFCSCQIHWKVTDLLGKVLASSRHTVSMSDNSLKPVEDEDATPVSMVVGESELYEPVEAVVRHLRQGGRAEMRLRRAPKIVQDHLKGCNSAVQQIMGAGSLGIPLSQITVAVEVIRVKPAPAGPGAEGWGGISDLVSDLFTAEQFFGARNDDAAERRFRRGLKWSEAMAVDEALSANDKSQVLSNRRAFKIGIAKVLIRRAGPVMDSGNVSSAQLKVAEEELKQASELVNSVLAEDPNSVSALMGRARILVATDDDFVGAKEVLQQAQEADPGNDEVKGLLRDVNGALAKQLSDQAGERLKDLQKHLQQGKQVKEALGELRNLADIVSWESILASKVGVPLKHIATNHEDPALRAEASSLIEHLQDLCKQNRPGW